MTMEHIDSYLLGFVIVGIMLIGVFGLIAHWEKNGGGEDDKWQR